MTNKVTPLGFNSLSVTSSPKKHSKISAALSDSDHEETDSIKNRKEVNE